MNRPTIYAITTFPPKGYGELRTFGYYLYLEDALQAVKENRCNMHESLYMTLVIEEIPEGIHAMSQSERWFEWDEVAQQWTVGEKPAELRGVTSFAMG